MAEGARARTGAEDGQAAGQIAGAGGMSFTARVFRAWSDPRASMRGILEGEPTEGRILMFAMTAGAILFAAECLRIMARAAGGGDVERLSAGFAAAFVALVILRPLMLYGLAAIAGGVARLFGGTGTWRASRAAVCWAELVAAPLGFALTLVELLLRMAGMPLFGLSPIHVAALAALLSYCIAEAHGFSRVWMVFLVIGGITLGVWALAHSLPN